VQVARTTRRIQMNIKSLIATFALVTAATSTAAMADVRAQGGITVGGSFSVNTTGPIVRDHRTPAPPVVVNPVYRPIYNPAQHTRIDWRGDRGHRGYEEPSYDNDSFSVIATNHVVYGSPTKYQHASDTFDMHNVRGLDQLQFGWVVGATTIKDVIVTYANGTSKTYVLGDKLTQNAANRVSRIVDLDNRPIRSITVEGWSWGPKSQFTILGK